MATMRYEFVKRADGDYLCVPKPRRSRVAPPQKPTVEELEAILAKGNDAYKVVVNPDGSIRAEPTDPEEQMQADNGRTLEPFGIVFVLVTTPILWAWHQVERMREWPWESILWYLAALGIFVAGIGLAILATR